MNPKTKRWLKRWFEYQVGEILGWESDKYDRIVGIFDETVHMGLRYHQNKLRLINELSRQLREEIKYIRSDLLIPLFTRSMGDISELKRSIKHSTMIMPIVVRPSSAPRLSIGDRDGTTLQRYDIICGYRRYQAALSAKIKVLPCIVKNINDEHAYKLYANENLHRKNWNPIEEAKHYKNWRDNLHDSEWTISSMIDRSQGYVSNRIRLLNLPTEVQTLIVQRKLTPEHGRVLQDGEFSLTPEEQTQWASTAHENKMGIRQLENTLRAARGTVPPTVPENACKKIRDLNDKIQRIKDEITHIYEEEINSLSPFCVECSSYELCSMAEHKLTFTNYIEEAMPAN